MSFELPKSKFQNKHSLHTSITNNHKQRILIYTQSTIKGTNQKQNLKQSHQNSVISHKKNIEFMAKQNSVNSAKIPK